MPDNKLGSLYPPLTPKGTSWMQEVSEDKALLNELFERYGSPINLHHYKPFVENCESYREVIENVGLDHLIFFARKANKCQMFAREAGRAGLGVDTASYRELKQCLGLGCAPERLVVTAAVKSERLMRLALQHEVLMILDNEDECRLLNRLAAEMNETPAVGIRISGFEFEGDKLYSRFGFDVDDAVEFITQKLAHEYRNLQFSGLHFHLNGYSIEERGEALIQSISLADTLDEKGVSTSFIDIGGGLLINYLRSETEWRTFWYELKKAVRGERPPVTFGNNGLGYKMIDSKLHGTRATYPYFNKTPKATFLARVLSYENEKGVPAAELLKKRDIQFRMEPGRSLLDQTGMTLAKVMHRKKDQQGNWLVGLQMNRSQLFSSSADFLLDPIFIPLQKAATNAEVPVYLTGGFCLEGDLILKRKIVLSHLPEVGDVIAFPNTAGYMMHFYETEAHLFKKSVNLVNVDGKNFVPDWKLKPYTDYLFGTKAAEEH